MKRLICLLLTLTLLVGLGGCGLFEKRIRLEGWYVFEDATIGKKTFTQDDFPGEYPLFVIFPGDGTATLFNGSEVVDCTVHSRAFYLDNGDVLPFTLEDELLTLRAEDGEFRFVRSYDEEPKPDEVREYLRTPSQQGDGDETQYWDGDWYGWWLMDNCTGQYEGMDQYWWDTCAHIELNDTGDASMVIWDESTTERFPYGSVKLTFTASQNGNGKLVSRSGQFGPVTIEQGDWVVESDALEISDCIYIEGTFSAAGGSFDYVLLLRPWGIVWDDVDEETLPYYYEDWYLPLIEANEEMPAELPTESEE